MRPLGRTGMQVSALGVGTNRWGASGKGVDVVQPVFSAALDGGVNLIDTAEMYQGGKSEQTIGECMRRDPRPAFVVSKFAPWPTRLSTKSIGRALDASLARLGARAIDLYLVHFPFTLLSIESMMDALAAAVREGKIRAVGVSNFNAQQMRRAAAALERHGVPLAANEVHYSLWHRAPEKNGVLDACRALDVALIAYYPLGKGRVSGRGPVDEAVARVAAARGKTVAQVALSWLLCKDPHVIAIPGATSVGHLRENIDALGWTLSADELAALDRTA